MTYWAIDQLTQDPMFQARVRACLVQEAERMKDDERPQLVALATDTLRGGGGTTLAFVRVIAAFPGLAEGAQVDDEAGAGPFNARRVVDQSKITDDEILGQCQEHWPTVANLYFDEDGTSKLT